jgi:hypothetical protein
LGTQAKAKLAKKDYLVSKKDIRLYKKLEYLGFGINFIASFKVSV